MLLTIPDLLTTDQVQQCRNALENAEWVDGRATAGHVAAKAKDNLQLPLDHPLCAEIGNVIIQALTANPAFMAAALPLRVLPPRFNRYQGGGSYDFHIDNSIFQSPNSPQRVRSDISTTVFFSNPDEYDGGELVIQDTYGEQSIKLPAGHAIVYPGTSLHRVMPVTRGVRFASFFWTQSLVRSDTHRALLYDLDLTIQGLIEQEASHESISRLTGTYHNLVRLWAEL
jgi:PKHD-type hydroxylase